MESLINILFNASLFGDLLFRGQRVVAISVLSEDSALLVTQAGVFKTDQDYLRSILMRSHEHPTDAFKTVVHPAWKVSPRGILA